MYLCKWSWRGYDQYDTYRYKHTNHTYGAICFKFVMYIICRCCIFLAFFQLHKYFIEIRSTIISDVTDENDQNGGWSEWSSFGNCTQKHDIEIVICPSHLKDDCHVMDTSQIQEIVKRMNVLVGTFNSVQKSRI